MAKKGFGRISEPPAENGMAKRNRALTEIAVASEIRLATQEKMPKHQRCGTTFLLSES